ncbi:MAG: coenzyme F420 hydrogenase [Dehalococcoidia bacterium]|nr:coenzyme F420 hydrogenase [Dehalococcoidia bacterium]
MVAVSDPAAVAVKDPSADIRDDIAINSGVPELMDKIWFHKTASAVIDAGRCVQCGACIAACPSNSIEVAEDGLPTLLRMCTGCSGCWDFCPLAGMRPERLWKLAEGEGSKTEGLGMVRAAYSARALEPAAGAQDGGVVTAILEELLVAGEIDGVLTVERQGALRGRATIASTVDEIRESAGSVYEQTLPLALPDFRKVSEGRRLAMVGTGCQITGLRALQRYGWRDRQSAANAVKVAIGLLCTRSFDGNRLLLRLAGSGVDLRLVKKLDVNKGILFVYGEDGQVLLERPVKEFGDASLLGCAECADFTARLADISVGSIGSSEGWSTVFLRTEVGEKSWEMAQHRLVSEETDQLATVRRLERRNRRQAIRHLNRSFDPDAPLWISYSEHLQDYAGTDKEPVTPPDYRSHHYQTAC